MHELGDTHFLDMRCLPEDNVDVGHIGASSCEDDTSQKLVGIFVGHLRPYVFHYFLDPRLDNLDEGAVVYRTLRVDRKHQGVVYVGVVGICAAVFKLHPFRLSLIHLQRLYVFRDVAAAERNDRNVTEYVAIVYRYGGRVGSNVNEHAP